MTKTFAAQGPVAAPTSMGDSIPGCRNSTAKQIPLDQDGLPLITRETIIWELWCSGGDSHAMSIIDLTEIFELNKTKNARIRRTKFREIVSGIAYIQQDPVKGFTLALKKRNYPAMRN